MQKIFTTAAMTLAAMAALVATTSCSDDDDFAGINGQSEFANDMNTRSTVYTANPEDLAENQHVGAQIVKKVEGYGDSVVFTCLTDKAPFYFVHVSDRQYKASEMDDMQYQQNQMAPDHEMMVKLSQATQDFVYSILGKTVLDGHRYVWSTENGRNFRTKFKNVFQVLPICDLNDGEDIDCYLETTTFWYRNYLYSYPYAYFCVNAYSYSEGNNHCDEDHHFCYASTDPHRLLFYVVGHSANPQDQALHDAKYAPADSCYLGGTVTKNIDNYGEAKFVCISEQAPYYFVHVSDTTYTAAQKDAMLFQQNEYAVTFDLLQDMSKDAFKLAQGILTTPIKGKCCTGYTVANVYYYAKAERDAVCDKLNKYFKKFYCSDSEGSFMLKNVWAKNNDFSYPYGGIFLDFKCEGGDVSKCRNYYAGQRNSFVCYASADPCYFMYAFKVE